MQKFKLHASYAPTGDQPQAIEKLTKGVKNGAENQVLLGVTGSGKTFTVAQVIQNLQKPTLVISHNKTLAAQLFQEFREFFPKNRVEYFVSYYDYYQPEAYVPQRDLYIEKEVDINEDIDRLRLSATASLMTRGDVIVVASVSCIYNLGSPVEYAKAVIEVRKGMKMSREDIIRRLSGLFYERNEYDFKRATFRVRGDVVETIPSYTGDGLRFEFLGEKLVSIKRTDPVTGDVLEELETAVIYPAKHYITAAARFPKALEQIEKDLEKRIKELKTKGKELEAHRLSTRTKYDLELIREMGYCPGIENYSRYFDGRSPGDPPFTLLDFFPKDYLLVIDESHMTIPQIRGMYAGDKSRKETLIEYGFRLPSALDNRPLRFGEFKERQGQTIYVSATPQDYEMNLSAPHIVEQLIRPTGLLDPEIEIRPTDGQIDNLIGEITERVKKKERILVTTLTKRMAEDLSSFLEEKDFKVHYLHADIDTLVRSDILEDLRKGKYDVIVGINLLREGLDLPEVSLVAILDADKEGFLRSSTALIQTMGRAARNVSGKVILYADYVTQSMRTAIDEVERRRRVQEEYNKRHGIKPKTIIKPVRARLVELEREEVPVKDELLSLVVSNLHPKETKDVLEQLSLRMKEAAETLDFETAVKYREKIKELKSGI